MTIDAGETGGGGRGQQWYRTHEVAMSLGSRMSWRSVILDSGRVLDRGWGGTDAWSWQAARGLTRRLRHCGSTAAVGHGLTRARVDDPGCAWLPPRLCNAQEASASTTARGVRRARETAGAAPTVPACQRRDGSELDTAPLAPPATASQRQHQAKQPSTPLTSKSLTTCVPRPCPPRLLSSPGAFPPPSSGHDFLQRLHTGHHARPMATPSSCNPRRRTVSRLDAPCAHLRGCTYCTHLLPACCTLHATNYAAAHCCPACYLELSRASCVLGPPISH